MNPNIAVIEIPNALFVKHSAAIRKFFASIDPEGECSISADMRSMFAAIEKSNGDEPQLLKG